MRRIVLLALALLASAASAGPALSITPEDEQAFLDAYKAAYDAQDREALTALMHTEGAIAAAVDFYLMQMTGDFGGILTLELVDLTAEESAGLDEVLTGPDDQPFVLLPRPYKKLEITVLSQTQEGNLTSSGAVFVAEEGDHLIISMPSPAPQQQAAP